MFLVNQLVGFGVGEASAAAGGAIGLTYIGSTADTSDGSTYTYTDHAIGTAASDRIVLVAIQALSTGTSGITITGCTIGGNAATEVIQATGAGTGTQSAIAGIYGLLVTSGTTATIAFTLSSSVGRSAIGVFRMTGRNTVSAHDTGSATATQTLADTIAVPANGAVLACLMARQAVAYSTTWSEPSTEAYDATNGDLANSGYSGAYEEYASSNASLSVSATTSAAITASAMVCASFGP